MWIKYILGFSFIVLVSCGETDVSVVHLLSEGAEDKSKKFFIDRLKEDKDRDQILEAIYDKGKPCEGKTICRKICENLFTLSEAKDTCLLIPESYIYQIDKFFSPLIKGDFTALKQFSASHLKVFLNISPRSFYLFVRSLDNDFQREELLHWISEDWKVALVFYEEDWDFLFLESFFQSQSVFPLELIIKDEEGFNFVEKAWINQNDHALNWIHAWFSQSVCEDEQCIFKQYCYLIQDFHPDILEDFQDFGPLNTLLKARNDKSCQVIL